MVTVFTCRFKQNIKFVTFDDNKYLMSYSNYYCNAS